ncbi:MAG: glycosyltransferase family 4 protein [Gammaproteobacteria bacterium]
MAATRQLRLLLSAYACEPDTGSEPGVGWHWMLALLRRGHHVCVITRANNRPGIERACTALNLPLGEELEFIYYDLPAWASWWKKGGRGVHLYYALWQHGVLRLAREAHRRHRFDAVHHLTFGVWREPSLLYRLGLPFVYGPVGGGDSAPPLLRNTLPFKPRAVEWLREWINTLSLLNPVLRACLQQASLVVSKTPETAAWVRRGGARGDTVSLEIGIDSAKLSPRSATRMDGEPLRCLYAGRLIGLKGVHLAIDALAEARRLGGEVVLTIVGDGPMRANLESRVAGHKLQPYVQFIPWLSQVDLFQQYREHDALLFPSLRDSSGNVVLEAMAHGLPVVCLKLGGPGVLVDDSCGYAVVPHATSADATSRLLGSTLRHLQGDTALWRQLREGALARAAATSWESAAANIYERFPARARA